MRFQLCIPVCRKALGSLRHSSQRSLFTGAAGYRHRESGALTAVGTEGTYASSSSYAAGNLGAGSLGFSSAVVLPLSGYTRAYGFSVRCVQHLHGPLSFLRRGIGDRPARRRIPKNPGDFLAGKIN
ncbi:MAG: fibrobacter succinogenes major paralogous domain-containing protein [Alistipes sp.]|nr:fibrobacter succinogenes major paralogous domain-containing protein [Alistipes sp.]